MSKLKFNINNHVYVRLTLLGEAYLYEQMTKPFRHLSDYEKWEKDLKDSFSKMKQEDGLYKIQMHEFLDIFGSIDSIESLKYYGVDFLFDSEEFTKLK